MGKGLLAGLMALFVVTGCVSPKPMQGAADIRLQLALHYMAIQDYPAAQRNLLRAQAISPRDYRVPLAMARLAQVQHNDREARRYYLIAQQLKPDNGYVANNYGAFLCALGQYDEAHQQFKLAGDAAEQDARADSSELSGYCYLEARDDNAARMALIAALDADRGKGDSLLTEAERRMDKKEQATPLLLLEVYHLKLPASARSLGLQIRFAAQQGNTADVTRYGGQLARSFPQSIQYQRYLANEY